MPLYPETSPPPKQTARFAVQQPASARKVRSRALVFMGVALLAGICAAWLITVYLARRANQVVQVKVPTVRVAVAASDLPIATMLNKEMVELIEWPQNSLPAGSLAELKGVEGRVTMTALLKGEPIVESRLAGKGAGEGLAAVIPTNLRAMTVKVNEVIGVAGFIHPGDLVDVVTTMVTPVDGDTSGSKQEYRSKIVLQNIKVMAVGEDMVTMNAKPVKVPVVTLLVTPEQSEKLALASSRGEVQLTLRSQLDRVQVATNGISPLELLGVSSSQRGENVATATTQAEPLLSHHRTSRQHETIAVQPAVTVANTSDRGGDVIEVLHGDRVEERKVQRKESPK